MYVDAGLLVMLLFWLFELRVCCWFVAGCVCVLCMFYVPLYDRMCLLLVVSLFVVVVVLSSLIVFVVCLFFMWVCVVVGLLL